MTAWGCHYLSSRAILGAWSPSTRSFLGTPPFTEAHRVELQRCALVIEAMLRMTRLEQDNKALRQGRQDEAQMERKLQAEAGIIGQSVQLTSVLDELNVVADSELPVLLLGETGTGKELFARRLHALSPRAKKPMVYVNCAALPETLAESELFGHAKGAFSGAATVNVKGVSRAPTVALFSLMKSVNCHLIFKRSCCECCKTAKFNA